MKSSAQNHIDLLGKNAKDRVTGFQGVVESISFDLYGCIQVVMRPPVNKDGKLDEGRWFDVHRIELMGPDRVMPVPAFEATPPKFGAQPTSHTHGPAEKPARD